MAEELEELCRRLCLSKTEKNHIRLRKDKVAQSKQEAQHSLLFKLLTVRPFNAVALKVTVRNVLSVLGELTIRDTDDNLFMAVFSRRDDLDSVFVQSPWTFDKKLIQLVRFEGDLQPTAVSFKYSAFWIHVLNLPIKCMVAEVGVEIGNAIGRSIEVDVSENGLGWGHYLRICVDCDITQPLLRGKILEFDEGALFWVDFRYKHLPIFCYGCGVLGHGMNDCLEGRRSGQVGLLANDNYGPWLRAAPVRGGNTRRSREYSRSVDGFESVPSTRNNGESSVTSLALIPYRRTYSYCPLW